MDSLLLVADNLLRVDNLLVDMRLLADMHLPVEILPVAFLLPVDNSLPEVVADSLLAVVDKLPADSLLLVDNNPLEVDNSPAADSLLAVVVDNLLADMLHLVVRLFAVAELYRHQVADFGLTEADFVLLICFL